MKYKVGDKVVVRENFSGHRFKMGETIEIQKVTDSDYLAINEKGCSWWVTDVELVSINKDFTTEEIHITTKGRHTYAIKKQNGKIVARSEAKCHKDDKFDFNTGVNLCLERLGIKEEVKTLAPTTKHFAVGDIVTTDFYPNFGECIVVKVEDEYNAIWVTPLGHDEYTKGIVKDYITKGFMEHETAYHVGLDWNTVVKVG